MLKLSVLLSWGPGVRRIGFGYLVSVGLGRIEGFYVEGYGVNSAKK